MKKEINPVVAIAIGVVVFIAIGFVSWKIFGQPKGDYAPIPAGFAHPNGIAPEKK